jgi:hypothetical protein
MVVKKDRIFRPAGGEMFFRVSDRIPPVNERDISYLFPLMAQKEFRTIYFPIKIKVSSKERTRRHS